MAVEPVFDDERPPPRERLDDCVHCGFCLPTCPTYDLWSEEMDSPRGRIDLMSLAEQTEIGLDEVFVRHMDRCLGCMACVTACPSGVRYDELIEATRAQIERRWRRPRADRWFRALVFWLFPHTARLRAAVSLGWVAQRLGVLALLRRPAVSRRLPARMRALVALLPPVRLVDVLSPGLRERVAARGPARLRVGLLTGCVQSVLFAPVNRATARVLATEGCDVLAPAAQGCCGALMVHAGREPQAIERAKATIATFEAAGVDRVVTNAAGCGSTLEEYGRLLADDPAWAERAAAFAADVRDVTELLDELKPRGSYGRIDARVAYHDACHLAHAQGVRTQPRRVLRRIPGVDLVDVPRPELCCGSAGIYNLVEPEAAEELGRRKAADVRAVAPDLVATANPGCLLQLRHHAPELRLVHPVHLLDLSLRRGSP